MKIYSSRNQSDLAIYKQYAGEDIWLKVSVTAEHYAAESDSQFEYVNIIMLRDDCIYFREVSEIYLHDNELSDDDLPDVEFADIDDPIRTGISHFCSTTKLVRPLDMLTTSEMEDLLQTELNATENMISITEDEWEL